MRRIVDKPSPVTGGQLELCTEKAEVTFRGETIAYEKSFYRCLDSGLEFVDKELENANLKSIYDTYRQNHCIPLAEELTRMRERYGIPSRAMSLILGLGENQYSLYENGTVPSASVGNLLAFAKDPAKLKLMLYTARSAFSDKEYNKYLRAIDSSLHPAYYETVISIFDYVVYNRPFCESVTLKLNSKPSSKKEDYNACVYAEPIR